MKALNMRHVPGPKKKRFAFHVSYNFYTTRGYSSGECDVYTIENILCSDDSLLKARDAIKESVQKNTPDEITAVVITNVIDVTNIQRLVYKRSKLL